jgi:hypothetical protein
MHECHQYLETDVAAKREASRLSIWRESLLLDRWCPARGHEAVLLNEQRRAEHRLVQIYWPERGAC